MSISKTKKKVALIKATCYALELHPTIKTMGELKEAHDMVLEAGETLKEETLSQSRELCTESLKKLKSVISHLSPAKLRKALERQVNKIENY